MRYHILTIFLFVSFHILGQDTLTTSDLEPYTYYFTIEDSEMKGEGAEFLKSELSKAQYTMIGEYHGSKQISIFTKALIKKLDQVGYKTMGLEVGPISGSVLNSFSENASDQLLAVNNRYGIMESDGYLNSPIPFFAHKADADFLHEAKDSGWQLFGIDQEFTYGYPMLMDMLYENLSSENKNQLLSLQSDMKDSMEVYMEDYVAGNSRLSVSLDSSQFYQDYLRHMAIEPLNRPIIDALNASCHIYGLNASRQWYNNTKTRILYMKKQLKSYFDRTDFDLSSDKMLIKMGGYHLQKGFGHMSWFEVGNTLHELAEYHGNTSLNINFSNRYYVEGDVVEDIMGSNSKRDLPMQVINVLGKKDEWVIIDLRQLINGAYYYPLKYKLNEQLTRLVERYDLLLITPQDMEDEYHYSTSSTR